MEVILFLHQLHQPAVAVVVLGHLHTVVLLAVLVAVAQGQLEQEVLEQQVKDTLAEVAVLILLRARAAVVQALLVQTLVAGHLELLVTAA